jgi:hypothetical protein
LKRTELSRRETMQQIDPETPVETQVRELNEAYRNLYDRFEQYRKIIDEFDYIING